MSTFNNAKWVGLSQFTKVILQIMALIIFSRLLDPLEYGIMAMATVISNFALIIRDLGTGAAVIQRKVISNDLLSSIFWLNIIMGLLVMVAIIICAPLLSEFFKESKLCNVLLLLSVTFPLASAAIVHQANLEREFQFAKVCSIEIASSLISFLIGIVCAIKNYGVYSLVALTISQAMISTLGMWFASKWRPQFKVNWSEIQEVYSFSGNLTLFNMVNYFSRNSDGIIIGRFFSSAILGAYSLAYRIMLFPVQSLTSVISRSLYPVISRMQDDVNSINHVYMRTLAFISTLTLPLMMGLWSIRNEFVMEILGAKWISVVGILSWLAPTGYIQSLVSTTGTILMACGRANILFYLGVAAAVLQVSA
ncbi:TPA: O83 family O-antigen flippase, partial [Escherichia coli]|nr:O83 family O-antigen flippase [Escherichia coli]